MSLEQRNKPSSREPLDGKGFTQLARQRIEESQPPREGGLFSPEQAERDEEAIREAISHGWPLSRGERGVAAYRELLAMTIRRLELQLRDLWSNESVSALQAKLDRYKEIEGDVALQHQNCLDESRAYTQLAKGARDPKINDTFAGAQYETAARHWLEIASELEAQLVTGNEVSTSP